MDSVCVDAERHEVVCLIKRTAPLHGQHDSLWLISSHLTRDHPLYDAIRRWLVIIGFHIIEAINKAPAMTKLSKKERDKDKWRTALPTRTTTKTTRLVFSLSLSLSAEGSK